MKNELDQLYAEAEAALTALNPGRLIGRREVRPTLEMLSAVVQYLADPDHECYFGPQAAWQGGLATVLLVNNYEVAVEKLDLRLWVFENDCDYKTRCVEAHEVERFTTWDDALRCFFRWMVDTDEEFYKWHQAQAEVDDEVRRGQELIDDARLALADLAAFVQEAGKERR